MAENITLLILSLLPLLTLRIAWDFIKARNQSQQPASRRAVVVGNLLVFLLLVSVLAFGAEVYFRFFVDTTDSFSLSKTSERWFERHFHRNLAGFRDSMNYLPEIEPGKRRISFLGDSFTAAQGIANVERRFANRIRAMRRQDEIHVLAECGWDTQKQLELVRFLPISGYQTDVVVLVYCLNDISDLIPEWQDHLHQIYDASAPGAVIRSSYLLDHLHSRFRMRQLPEHSDYYSVVRDAYQGDIWEMQKARLTELERQVQKSGGTLLVVTFPFLHALSDYKHDAAHQQLATFWNDAGVPHLDLLPAFLREYAQQPDAAWAVNARDAHPGEFAHELSAELINTFLDSRLSQIPSPASSTDPSGPADPEQ